MKRALLMIPAVLIAGAALAAGQAAKNTATPMRDAAARQNRMAMLDTNKDGKISRAEAAANPRLSGGFERMDLNKDGFIDATDRAARRAQFQAKRADMQQKHFSEVDVNKDGKLSKEEMHAFHARKQAERSQKMASREGEMFTRMDTNKDGFISLDEMKAAHKDGVGKRGKHGGMRHGMHNMQGMPGHAPLTK